MGHKHDWKEIARTFAEPAYGASFTGGTERLATVMAFGLTTILWECADPNCCELRREELLGKEMKA